MNVSRVDFLNDLNKTIDYLKSNLKEGDTIFKIKFYKPSSLDNEYLFERIYSSFDNIDLTYEDYLKVEKITMVIKNENYLKTIQCDKNNNIIAITDNNATKKETASSMANEVDYSSIVKDDGCTYYEFEYGQIGKYNPLTSCYYIYENGEWKISGSVMRWIEDPAYDYKIIKEPKTNNNIIGH